MLRIFLDKLGEQFPLVSRIVENSDIFIAKGMVWNMYKVFTTDEFERLFDKLDKSLQIQIEKEIEQLQTSPYGGKPLGYEFFREKKVRNYRIYYLVYEEYVVVFIVTLSDKKDQQKAINTIKKLIPIYREEIKKKLNL